jgi:hypothetical protein
MPERLVRVREIEATRAVMMSVHAVCPACGENFRRPNSLAGKLEKCPACRHVFRLPAAAIEPTGNPPKALQAKAPLPTKPPQRPTVAKAPPTEEPPPKEPPKAAELPSAAEAEAGRVEWPEPSPRRQPDEGRQDQGSPVPIAEIEALSEPAPDLPANKAPARTALVVQPEAPPPPVPGEPQPTEHEGVWEIFPLNAPLPSPSATEDSSAPPADAEEAGHVESTLPPTEPRESPSALPDNADNEQTSELRAFPEPSEPSEPLPLTSESSASESFALEPSASESSETAVESPPTSGVDYVSLAAERLGAGRSRQAVRAELIRAGLHPDDAKEVVNVMGKECDRQRKKGVSLLTVIVGVALAVIGLPAWLVCHFHVPPYRGAQFIVAGFGLAGLVLFFLGLWRLAIKPARVNPQDLTAVWEEPQ